MKMINEYINKYTKTAALQMWMSAALVLLFAGGMFAQQEAQYTNFMFNKLPLNPAYAGSKEVACVSALYRSQWVGIEGAPTTTSVNFHTPLFDQRVGLGIGIERDVLGLLGTWRGNIAYAYRPKVGKGHLSIGVVGSVISHRYDGHLANTTDGNDPTVSYEGINRYYPNFGGGLYYNTETFYAGVSIPTLLSHEIDYGEDGFEGYSYKDRRHLYVMMGGLLNISEKIQFKPAALIKYVGLSSDEFADVAAPFDMDINAMFIFLDAFGIGATWRLGDSIDGLLFFQAAEQFRIGMGYDYSLTELQDYNQGTFEIMAEYCFRSRNKKMLNPRFFF